MSEPRFRRMVLPFLALTFLLNGSRAVAGVCDSGIFPRPSTYPIASYQQLVAVADLNEDSHADVVLFVNPTISIMYGSGEGTLGAPVTVPLSGGRSISQVFVRDANGDGHLDLVLLSAGYVGSTYTYSVDVLRGNGNGTFQSPVSTTIDSLSVSLLGDFDGDGLPDLIGGQNGTLKAYRNLGNGAFQSAVSSVALYPPSALVAGDFDGDAHLDLIAIDYQSPTLSFFRGVGNGSFLFSSSIASGSIQRLMTADLDGDGHLDLVASLDGNYAFFGVAHGNGNGSFDAFHLYSRGTGDGPIAIGDLDGDGRPDIVGLGFTPTSPGFEVVSILRNLGDGQYRSPTLYASNAASWGVALALALADLSGDGRLDVISTDGSLLNVIAGDGAGGLIDTFTRLTPVPQAAADMNGDGIVDLIDVEGSSVNVFLGLGQAEFEGPITQTIGGSVLSGVAAIDLNGDAHVDVVVTANYGSNYWVLLGNGDGTLQPAVPYSAYVSGPIYTGDFDGDGHVDLLLPSGGGYVLALGNGDGTFSGALAVDTIPQYLGSIVVADFNDDGRDDVAGLTNPFSLPDKISISRSNGDGTFQAPLEVETGSNNSVTLAAANLNADGYPDLVVGNDSADSVSIFLSDGAGGFQPPDLIGTAGSADSVILADLDQDGILDLATGSNGSLYVLRGLPGGDFESPQRFLTGPASRLFLGDVDGNGTPDLITDSGWILLNTRLAVRVPATLEVCLGSPATLTAHAGGAGAISYQWRKGGAPLSDGGGVSGTHTATLTIAATGAGDAGNYDVVVNDACGTVTSSAVSLVVVTQLTTPSISAPASVPPLSTGVTASVPAAAGHTYQWTITGGSITSGQGTHQIAFSVGAAGTGTSLHVVDTTAGGCSSNPASFVVLSDFLDVPASHPFHSFVVKLARNGITGGCGGGNFCPDSTVTRAQMAVFLLLGEHGASYVPPPATGTVFTDVPLGSFAAAFIERLAAEAITGGCGPALYCPANPVTRAQMAVFLLRAEHGSSYTPPPATGAVFADVPIGSFAAAWIERLAAEGITGGCGNGNYCPGASATRGQMAVFLSKTFNLP